MKMIKKTFLLFYYFEVWNVFCSYGTIHFRLAIFQVFNSHVGLEGNVVDSKFLSHHPPLWKFTNPVFLLQGSLSAFDSFFIQKVFKCLLCISLCVD